MVHATDAEEAIEAIELGRWETHGIGDVVIVAGGIVRGDDGVHLAMIMYDLPSAVLEGAEVAFPGLDVEGVLRGGIGGCRAVEGAGVPRRIIENRVSEPVFGVWEGLAIIFDVSGGEFAAGLHAGVDEGAVFAVVVREDAFDCEDLWAREAGGCVFGV